MTDQQLDLAECEAALREQKAANKRLSAELVAKAARIAELELQVQTLAEEKHNQLERVADIEAMYKFEATHNGMRMIEIGELKKRVAELEAQVANLTAYAQAVTARGNDGVLYADGCKPE